MNEPVSLREITFASVRAFMDLDVLPPQRAAVATNARSIAEAHYDPSAWLRGIYSGDQPSGLILLHNPAVSGAVPRSPFAPGDVSLWRLMVDHRFQGRGCGRAALDLACAQVRAWAGARRLVSSFVDIEHGPERFYLAYGFRKTGGTRAEGREVEIALEL